MKTFLAFLIVFCSLPNVAFARQPDTGFLNRSITLNGAKYRYQVYVPAEWKKHQKWPVLLFLHGYGERGSDGLLPTDVGIGHAIRTHPERFNFVVVIPQCPPDRVWPNRDMEEMAMAALEQTLHEFKGDRDRLYLTGLSMGGYATWDMTVRYPGKFAAFVAVCGGIQPSKSIPELRSSLIDDKKISDPYAETARRIGKTPVWIFHGAEDDSVPVEESRKMAAALKAAGANFKYTEYPGVGHNSWDSAYSEPELLPWLLAQRLQQAAN
jgi:predicted peptidase